MAFSPESFRSGAGIGAKQTLVVLNILHTQFYSFLSARWVPH